LPAAPQDDNLKGFSAACQKLFQNLFRRHHLRLFTVSRLRGTLFF